MWINHRIVNCQNMQVELNSLWKWKTHQRNVLGLAIPSKPTSFSAHKAIIEEDYYRTSTNHLRIINSYIFLSFYYLCPSFPSGMLSACCSSKPPKLCAPLFPSNCVLQGLETGRTGGSHEGNGLYMFDVGSTSGCLPSLVLKKKKKTLDISSAYITMSFNLIILNIFISK